MWKTIIYDIPGDTRIRIQLLYFDNEKSEMHSWGTDIIVEAQPSEAWLNEYILGQIARLDVIRSLPKGEYVATAPIVVPAPVDEKDVPKVTFQSDFKLLRQMQTAIEAGVLSKDDADYTALRDKVVTAIQDDKLTMLSLVSVA